MHASQPTSSAIPRLSTSSSVDSFLSWIAAPSSGSPSKLLQTNSRLRPSSTSPSSSPQSSSSSTTTEASLKTQRSESSSGQPIILADATRLRELSKSPLEEMGLPLFGNTVSKSSSSKSKKSSSASSESKSSRKTSSATTTANATPLSGVPPASGENNAA